MEPVIASFADDEENRVTPIASGSSAFSSPLRSSSVASSSAVSSSASSILYQQPFLYPSDQRASLVSPSESPQPDDMPSDSLDVHALERELRPVSALTPANVQRPVPVSPAMVYSEDSFEEEEDEEEDDEDGRKSDTFDENEYAAKRMQERRRKRWKEQLQTGGEGRNRQRRGRGQRRQQRSANTTAFDENGCNGQTLLFPTGFVSAFRNELVDVLEKLGQGCGSLGDSEDDEEDEEDSGLSEEEDDVYSTSQTRSTVNTARVLQESFSDVTARTKYQMKDQKFLRAFISTLTQSGVIVLHHRPGVVRPTKCLAFLQQGFQGNNGKYRAPLLVWKPVEEEGEGDTVDIFSLLSLDKAAPTHLKQYPLAMPGRTVVLETNQQVILELRSEEDAFRFVHGIRWIVARLSFNLIIGNLSVSCEMLDVGRKERGDRFGQSPSTEAEEIQWMTAMNDVTCELVGEASRP